MILCGGDSFSKFLTPLGQYTAKDLGAMEQLDNIDVASGLSAVELLMERYNIAGTSIGWEGASIDATAAKTINYITNHKDVKFLFFYLTASVRIMYSQKTTGNYEYAYKDYDDPHFFNTDEITNVHYPDNEKDIAYKYFLFQPTYKKYYDRYAYLNFLTNVCKNRGIKILFIRTTDDELDTSMFLDNNDNTRIINIKLPADLYSGQPSLSKRHSNHLFPQEQKALSEQIVDLHGSFLLDALHK
jgi:hypothetical protein|tara:strand:+ start:14698 stop:15426 length:729 start_codon:yes stop_codon:yes gene_type:complete